MSIPYKLLSNASATGSPVAVQGGYYSFAAVGTWGGSTLSLQLLGPDGTTYIDLGGSADLTANGAAYVSLPSGTVKAVLTGGAPSGIYATLSKIDLRQ